eukprot:scaffold4851_cov126-Isochrysis_galbana.AAC.7
MQCAQYGTAECRTVYCSRRGADKVVKRASTAAAESWPLACINDRMASEPNGCRRRVGRAGHTWRATCNGSDRGWHTQLLQALYDPGPGESIPGWTADEARPKRSCEPKPNACDERIVDTSCGPVD